MQSATKSLISGTYVTIKKANWQVRTQQWAFLSTAWVQPGPSSLQNKGDRKYKPNHIFDETRRHTEPPNTKYEEELPNAESVQWGRGKMCERMPVATNLSQRSQALILQSRWHAQMDKTNNSQFRTASVDREWHQRETGEFKAKWEINNHAMFAGSHLSVRQGRYSCSFLLVKRKWRSTLAYVQLPQLKKKGYCESGRVLASLNMTWLPRSPPKVPRRHTPPPPANSWFKKISPHSNKNSQNGSNSKTT